MRNFFLCVMTALVLALLCGAATAQHYTDWSEFEYLPIADELYQLQKDYTISLPEYFLDQELMPDSAMALATFFHEWAANALPTCDWDFVRLEEGGIITVKRGFRWDGPSYPNRDHSDFNIRSSMIHDALYDMMRMEYMLPDTNHEPPIYIPFYGDVCPDIHSFSDTGDVNRFMTDLMIYFIAVEDGQELDGLEGAEVDVSVIRFGGAPATYDLSKLENWKYHVSQLTAYATDGNVELEWKSPNYCLKDPAFENHFIPITGYKIRRNGADIGTVNAFTWILPNPPVWVTSFEDNDVVNGEVYKYQILPMTVNTNLDDWSNEESAVPMDGPGRALLLDGVDDYLEANNTSNDLVGSAGFNGSVTMEAWVCPDEKPYQEVVFAFNTISGDNIYLLTYDGVNHKFCYYDDVNDFVCSLDDYPAGDWYHVAVTIDETNAGILWVNGVQQESFTASATPSHGARFSIGQEWDGSSEGQHFKGMIDEARIWNVARTAPQILADMYHPLRGDETGLIGLWHFDEPNDYTVSSGIGLNPPGPVRKAFDATAYANDGLLIGSLVFTDTVFVSSGAMEQPADVDNGVGDRLPRKFELAQNYPNPFNPSTTIEYYVPSRAHVNIEVFNLLGQKIKTLVDETKPAGDYVITWDGNDSNGQVVSSGIYFYRYRAGDFAETKRMLLLK